VQGSIETIAKNEGPGLGFLDCQMFSLLPTSDRKYNVNGRINGE
jgi:hypothetical protein